MNSLTTILREIYGLFVDDGFLALGILLWLAVLHLLLPHLPHPSSFDGPILFAGLALILLTSALRFATRKRR